MAVVQNSYSELMPAGLPGQVANGEAANRISRTVEDAAGLGFGRAAFRGAGDQGCTGTPAAGAFLGFVTADASVAAASIAGGNADAVPQHGSAAILTKGALLVTAGEAVTAGAAVYVTGAGAIVDTATANTAAPGWLFDAGAAAGAIVRIANRG